MQSKSLKANGEVAINNESSYKIDSIDQADEYMHP